MYILESVNTLQHPVLQCVHRCKVLLTPAPRGPWWVVGVGGEEEHQSVTCSQQPSPVLCHAPLGVFQAWCDITGNCIFQYSFLPFHKLHKYFWIMECTTHFVQNIYFHLYSTDFCNVNIYLLIAGRLYKFNFLDNSSQANVVWVSCTLLFLLNFWCGLCKGSQCSGRSLSQ